MAINLTWANPNTGTTSIKIYRSTSPLVLSALPAPLVTLPANSLSYSDTTTTLNTLYYYIVSVVVGVEEVYGESKPMADIPYTGPGPQTIIRGNVELGYFGQLSQDLLFTFVSFNTAVGISGVNVSSGDVIWHKWMLNGKVTFVPDFPTHWSSGGLGKLIYDLGAMYGTDDNGLKYTASLPSTLSVVQNKRVTLGADVFRVRTPKGSIRPTNESVLEVGAHLSSVSSEAGKLIVCNGTFWTNSGWQTDTRVPQPVHYNGKIPTSTYYVLTQHYASATQMQTFQYNQGTLFIATALTVNTHWWPLLELEY